MAARQLEVPGTERHQLTKPTQRKLDAHRDAINAVTQANKERRDTRLAFITALKEEGIKSFKDTEGSPPIVVNLSQEDKLTIKRLPQSEGDEEVEEKPKRGAKKKSKGDDAETPEAEA